MTTALTTTATAQVQTAQEFGGSLIDRFVKFAGVSPSSQKTYAKSLRQLFAFFAANSITRPCRADLVAWLDGMKESGKSPSTVQLYLTSAKIFFRWLSLEGIYPNVADNLKSGVKPSHAHKKDALSAEQCAALIKSVKPSDNAEMVLRDKAILALMTTAGLRCIEVTRANVGDIRHERGKVFLYVQGKGHADADEKVLLSTQTYRALTAYLKIRHAAASAPLFVSTSRSNKGRRLDTQTIRKMVKTRLRAIGLDSPRLTAHSLRHSAATNLVFAGVELPKVQMILRHRNLNTTMIYAAAWNRYTNEGEQLLSDMIFKDVRQE